MVCWLTAGQPQLRPALVAVTYGAGCRTTLRDRALLLVRSSPSSRYEVPYLPLYDGPIRYRPRLVIWLFWSLPNASGRPSLFRSEPLPTATVDRRTTVGVGPRRSSTARRLVLAGFEASNMITYCVEGGRLGGRVGGRSIIVSPPCRVRAQRLCRGRRQCDRQRRRFWAARVGPPPGPLARFALAPACAQCWRCARPPPVALPAGG